MVSGGIVGLFYETKWPSIASIPEGLLVLLLEMPVPGLKRLGFVYSNLYFRAALYVLLTVPLAFSAPTTTGGLALLTSAIVYTVGALNKEQFIHPKDYGKRTKHRTISAIAREEEKMNSNVQRTLDPKYNPFNNIQNSQRVNDHPATNQHETSQEVDVTEAGI